MSNILKKIQSGETLKHDNCKNCIRTCEHAGKDRDFCYRGESCKKTADEFGDIRKKAVEKFAETLLKKIIDGSTDHKIDIRDIIVFTYEIIKGYENNGLNP